MDGKHGHDDGTVDWKVDSKQEGMSDTEQKSDKKKSALQMNGTE